MLAITNSRFFRNDILIANETVLINQGKIVGFTTETSPNGYAIINAEQNFLVPGFLDLQIYGSGGNLFSAYPTADTLAQMDQDLLDKGTVGFLACVATNSDQVIASCIDAAKAYRAEAKGFLGLHLEGPYLNPKRRGAHLESFIKKATLMEVKRIVDRAEGVVKMMTLAPELQDDEVIQFLLDNHIKLSVGHSDATFAQATDAYYKGFTTTTHLFNAMPPIHHRQPNLPVAVLNHKTAMSSIIADGLHVDFEMVKLAYQQMGERLFVITDAVTSCSIGPYQHQLDGDKFITPDGTLSGSNITMAKSINNCVAHCGIAMHEALKLGTSNPAKILNMDKHFGKIEPGYEAKLVLLDADFIVKQVIFDRKN